MLSSIAALMLVASPAAYAQNNGAGAAAGAATGAVGGAVVGGPVGAAVGGVAGAVIGGIASDQQPRFREYVVQHQVPNYSYRETVKVGTVLPSDGVTYREVPAEYGRGYRYARVNDRTVIIEPSTHKVVQIIE
nr:DUF1236 domain-containing protein [Chelatococcus reniformis]